MITDRQKLLRWQPHATNIRHAGKCDNCKRDGLLFYQHPDFDQPEPIPYGDRMALQGGYYCPRCEFSNAGWWILPKGGDDGY